MYLEDLILPFFLSIVAVGLLFTGIAGILYAINLNRLSNATTQAELEAACEAFSSDSLADMPLRCVPFYTE